MNIKIPYFIYTSGEKGMHGLDWGVKFVSPNWGTASDADQLYRTLMDRYGLKPSLERPDAGEAGFLILPISKGSFRGYLFGIFQPYRDSDAQGNRPNITLLACLISYSMVRDSGVTPGQIGAALLQQEGLNTIGFRAEDRHPRVLKRRSEIELDISSVSHIPHALSNLDAWPQGAEGIWVFDGKLRKIFPSESHKFAEDNSRPGGLAGLLSTEKLRNKWIIGLGFLACIVVLFFIFRDGSEQLPAKPQKEKVIAELKPIERSLDQEESAIDLNKERPKAASASSLIEIFTPSDRKAFQFIAMLNTTQMKAFMQGGRVANVKLFPLDEKAAEPEKGTFHSIGQTDEGFLVTPEVIFCLLQGMAEKWLLQYSEGKSTYYPLQIVSKTLHEGSERLGVISSNIYRCGAKKISEIRCKESNPDSRLESTLNKVFLDQKIDKTEPDSSSRIVFFASTTEEGVFRGHYVEKDVANREIPRSNILLADAVQIEWADPQKLSNDIGRLFIADPERPDLLKLTDKKMDKELIEEMKQLKETQEKASNLVQDLRILTYLSEQIFKRL